MWRLWRTALIAAVAGGCLGAWQVVRENRVEWDAVHATLGTIIVQTGAGALIGGVFVATILVYLVSRRPTSGRVARHVDWAGAHGPVRPPMAGPARDPSMIRHALILVFALGLVTCGGIVAVAVLRHPGVYAVLRGGAGAAFLIGLGLYLVWDDFVAPRMAVRARTRSGPG